MSEYCQCVYYLQAESTHFVLKILTNFGSRTLTNSVVENVPKNL